VRPGPVPLCRSDPLRRRAYAVIGALRAERLRRGLSQAELGLSFGAALKAVSNWENGWGLPDARSVRLWSSALGMKVPADVEIVFRPDVPRCPSRPAYERHRKRGETCTTCLQWFNRHRRELRAAKRAGSVQ
jgi:transcriptional regulator with XRE-family HTH domain